MVPGSSGPNLDTECLEVGTACVNIYINPEYIKPEGAGNPDCSVEMFGKKCKI